MTRLDEARRQQALLRVLWRLDPDTSIEPDVLEGPARAHRGLGAYRANGAAHARRALADIFPVLRALLGEEAFDVMALAYWRTEPPVQGDLSHAGDRMAAFIEHDEQLASDPYLADVARLECAL
ncbi:MAG: DNA-binding domain-containing protein, partial [Aquabacterium sp.]